MTWPLSLQNDVIKHLITVIDEENNSPVSTPVHSSSECKSNLLP